jgi:hypothetical protein
MRFCPATFVISLLLQRFICIHLLKLYLTVYSAFSPSVHHSSFTTFAAWSGLAILPVQRCRYFTMVSTPLLYHLYYSMLKNFSRSFSSRHKQRAQSKNRYSTHYGEESKFCFLFVLHFLRHCHISSHYQIITLSFCRIFSFQYSQIAKLNFLPLHAFLRGFIDLPD